DLAFDVRGDVAAADLREAVAAHAGPELERLVLFDVFSGPPLEEGRKSMAFRLTFRHPERTLTDEELEPVRRSISDHVTITLDGRLRGG
ncbi:phenylalanine--tRNA ligase subunit beta, partial [bacterium]|nr:phenylalanine--tRNA ligase subunit beta [bacterium]